jgi:hypothetical protein
LLGSRSHRSGDVHPPVSRAFKAWISRLRSRRCDLCKGFSSEFEISAPPHETSRRTAPSFGIARRRSGRQRFKRSTPSEAYRSIYSSRGPKQEIGALWRTTFATGLPFDSLRSLRAFSLSVACHERAFRRAVRRDGGESNAGVDGTRTRSGDSLNLVMAEDFWQQSRHDHRVTRRTISQRSSRILLNAPRAWQHGGNDRPARTEPADAARGASRGWDVGRSA